MKYVKNHSEAMIEEIKTNDIALEENDECLQQLVTFRFQAELVIGSTEQIQAMIVDCSTYKSKECGGIV